MAILSRSGTVLAAGLLVLAASAAVTAWRGIPEPAFHDEASYLLAADTFRHGRLANPPHPFWQHFEAFHVLQRPTYASKYPPGQGLLLALGDALGGHPIAGSWLGAAAMAAAACWMLAGFLPVRWALFGALLTAVQVGPTTYWAQGYWGGCLPAAGGALLFGALPRLRRSAGPGPALALAAGLVVLANTRPFEGLMAALLAAAVLPWRNVLRNWRRTVLPIVLVLAAAGAAMAFYNRAVTGNAWQMPYTLYESTASGLPLFVWQQAAPPPEFRHDIQQRLYDGYLRARYEKQRTLGGWVEERGQRLGLTWAFFFGPVLSLFVLALPWTWRQRGVGLALAGLGVFLLAAAVTSPLHPHYAAPFTGLAFLVVTAAARRTALFLKVRRRGAGALFAVLLLMVCAGERLVWTDSKQGFARRLTSVAVKPRIAAQLEEAGGRHLVLVRSGPRLTPHDDWVANGADVDGQTIVWARSMGAKRDRELVAYYSDRRAWRLDLGFGSEIRLVPVVPPLDPPKGTERSHG